MRSFILCLVMMGVLLPVGFCQGQSSIESLPSLSQDDVRGSLEAETGVTAEDISAANSWAQTIQAADWLGPLAPVAMSPFFGMACLCGLSLWGPEWVTNNALLGASGPLHNEVLFFAFVGLTILTSLPRLSKVSKPFAQAMDQLETYSVIVILLAIKFLADAGSSGADAETQVTMVQMGVFSFTLDTLLMLAMAINIIVVNSVKFFFEFLVWLTPIPTVDAIFEVCNKSLCAALMAVYAFSPALATIINLIILAVSLVVFRWMSRRVRFYRTMVVDPVLSKIWSSYGQPKEDALVVFPKQAIGPFAAKSRLKLTKSDGGWTLSEANWWMPNKTHEITPASQPEVTRGWVMHAVNVNDSEGQHLLRFSRRYDGVLNDLIGRIGLTAAAENQASESHGQAIAEFA